MKKFFIILAAALSFCLTGCYSSSTDVIYSVTLSNTGEGGIAAFSDKTREAYSNINKKLTAFSNEYCSEWIETVENNKFSKKDDAAKSKFNTAVKAFESVKSECDAIVNSLPSSKYDAFAICVTLEAKRYSDGEDHVLDSMDAKFVYGDFSSYATE